ncbi:Galactokinase [Candidatus Terasakiella magnetica]|uniref:Galactokinase n=1 Tax=Candidatus Terasakiella magnetica TaxID=1867952 RepID=A0A1C3RKJ2_9PROT|nr:kinase [Candidatus Terasakiella magnetica]SCA57842.1 Galactokinase [Candidatus Terasakiella magnetica]
MSLVITRTPFRVSFFGGGTDYPEWYLKEGGSVLSAAIDKYCYITARYRPPFFPTAHRVVWAHIESVQSISEILHPAVREGLRMLDFDDSHGIEILHQGDLPARTGMGSSSAFAVGLILALKMMRGQAVSQEDLYLKAIELEQDWLKDSVGSQDQVACAMGGVNVIDFNTDGAINVKPIQASKQRLNGLNSRLMMFYTGTSRLSSEVARDVISNIADRSTVLREMKAMVPVAQAILEETASDLDDFGRMMNETWQLKKSLSGKISNSNIDDIYEASQKAGALGGKLLGAGHSGFMMLYVPLDKREAVRQALHELMEVPFNFEMKGSRVLNDHGWMSELSASIIKRKIGQVSNGVQ